MRPRIELWAIRNLLRAYPCSSVSSRDERRGLIDLRASQGSPPAASNTAATAETAATAAVHDPAEDASEDRRAEVAALDVDGGPVPACEVHGGGRIGLARERVG